MNWKFCSKGAPVIPSVSFALRHNRYFGEANNIGVEAAAGTYVLLVNNDATVTSSHLEPLLAALQSGFRAGAVGPRFVLPGRSTS